jgi:hypothetical protein
MSTSLRRTNVRRRAEVGRRGRGEGSIYQRKDGIWVGALDLGWESGKRTRKFVHAATRREVVTGLAEYKRRIGLGQRIDRDEQTVKEFLVRWLAWKEGHVRARTYHGYKGYIERHIYPALGKKRLAGSPGQYERINASARL